VLYGGADIVYEYVGSGLTVDLSFRLARGGGRVCLVGASGLTRAVDWTSVWLKELSIKGSFGYGLETRGKIKVLTLILALEFLRTKRVSLSQLISHRFPLEAYREAFSTALHKKKSRAINVVFDFK